MNNTARSGALTAHYSREEQQEVLDFLFRSFAFDVGLMSGRDLTRARIAPDAPLEIHDLDGRPLFLDFTVVDETGSRIGVVRSSGRGSELTLIDAVMIGGSLFEPADAVRKALDKAAQDYPGMGLAVAGFVCYGYPRMGVAINVRGDRPRTVIYDAHMQYRVREFRGSLLTAARSAFSIESMPEGEPVYSYLALLPEAGENLAIQRQWADAFEISRQALRAAVRGRQPAAYPAVHGVMLPTPLVAQETPVYCAVATAKMILDSLGFVGYSQNEIAAALSTAADGTTNENMIRGLTQLTERQWAATLDTTPTFDEAKDYLKAFIPGKTGIPGHARLLRGWREYAYIEPRTGRVIVRDQYYIVNDPYPVGNGQLVMENALKPIQEFYRNLLALTPVTR